MQIDRYIGTRFLKSEFHFKNIFFAAGLQPSRRIQGTLVVFLELKSSETTVYYTKKLTK